MGVALSRRESEGSWRNKLGITLCFRAHVGFCEG
jgi:hypothetical protein